MISGPDAPYYGMSVSTVSETGDQITIKLLNSQNNRDGRDYYNKYGWKAALEPFVGTKGRTFKLSCDYPRKPKYITLTDLNEPTNIITVWADSYYFMDDNMDYYLDD
jgi:hypothetical protein